MSDITRLNVWYVYMVRTRAGALYTGVTTDLKRRMAEHAGEGKRGAKYLRAKGPLEVVYRVKIGDRGTALSVETRIKRLSKRDKETIVSTRPRKPGLCRRLGVDY